MGKLINRLYAKYIFFTECNNVAVVHNIVRIGVNPSRSSYVSWTYSTDTSFLSRIRLSKIYCSSIIQGKYLLDLSFVKRNGQKSPQVLDDNLDDHYTCIYIKFYRTLSLHF